jgi:sulfopyruvate decarboxylase subunit beta
VNLAEALAVVVPLLRDELVVHANGFISRESFNLHDRPGNFYMIGSMGLASSIALGVALNRPDRRVVVFDGDGNVLMNLGSLALIGATQPTNLLHIVFDNEVYGSTGNQRTISAQVELVEIARASGYKRVQRVDTAAAFQATVQEFLAQDGPSFLLVKITPDREERKIGRITHEPPHIAARFMKAIRS